MSKRSQGSLQKHEENENLKNEQRVLENEKRSFCSATVFLLGKPSATQTMKQWSTKISERKERYSDAIT